MKIKKKTLEDWALRFLSLIFAIMLWFFVVGEEKAETTINLPLEIVNLPADLIIANDIPSAIEVRVYGPRSLVRSIATERISKVINLKNMSPGKITEQIAPDTLPLPKGVQVLRVRPRSVEIVLEELVKKAVPVKPVIVGKPAPDFKLGAVYVDPPYVEVSGPKSQVNSLSSIKTLPVDIQNASSQVVKKIGLVVEGTHLNIEPSVVEVRVQIKKVMGEKVIKNVPLQLDSDISGVTWWPHHVTVKIRGWVRMLKEMKKELLTCVVQAYDLKPGIHYLEPICVPLEGFTVLSIKPKKIKVKVPKPSKPAAKTTNPEKENKKAQ